MYDFLNKIGLKIMLEAVKAKFPETLPANGGNADYADNADKLDGLHAASFLQNVVPVNLTTSINDMTTAGTYGVYSGTPDFPTGYGTWGFLEVRRFGLLCYQTIIFENGVIINRGRQTNNSDWVNWQRVNDNGNADMLDGKHANEFVWAKNITEISNSRIQIPNNVNVGEWLISNAKTGTLYFTNAANTGLTGLPTKANTDWAWYNFDGNNYFAKTVDNKMFYANVVNAFTGWQEIFTFDNKPYVTGEVTGTSGSDTIKTNHGFTPSAVFWWMISQGRTLRSAYSFDTTSFQIPSSLSEDALVNYIIFK